MYWPVYHGSFEEVKREIKSREDPQTILLIYFHSKDHPCVGHLRTNILCNKDVSQHFDHPRLISWIADVSTHPVYYELADKLGYHGYFPAFVFFGDFKGKLKMIKSISGTILIPTMHFNQIFVGNVTSDVLIAALNEIFEVFAMRSALMDHDAVQQTDDRVIRQDQDEAYRLSLEADRQKKIERIRKQELERQRDEEESRKQQDILAKNADKSAILARLKESISPEPASDDKDVITLCIQLIGGKRITRRFLKKTLLRVFIYTMGTTFYLIALSFLF